MSNGTKSAPSGIKPAPAATKRAGRPRLGAQPLSAAERSRRARARKRQAKPAPSVERQMAGVTHASVLADLIASRGLTSALHKSIAAKVADAFVKDDPATASRWMAFLPPMRAETASPTVSASDARARVLALVLNAVAADDVERAQRIERGEANEADMLRQRLAEIERPLPAPDEPDDEVDLDEVAALRAEVERLRLQLSGAQPVDGARASRRRR
jgi:hypothetical protein